MTLKKRKKMRKESVVEVNVSKMGSSLDLLQELGACEWYCRGSVFRAVIGTGLL